MTICTGPAPVERNASIGPWSISSIDSAKNLPSMPAPWIASAITPANGPSPTAATKISARMISLMPRPTLSTCRIAWKITLLRARLRAAKKHSGSARMIAKIVPQMAICTVSSAGRISLSMKAKLGGNIRDRKSRIHGPPLASSPKSIWLPRAANHSTAIASGKPMATFHQPSAPPGRSSSSR